MNKFGKSINIAPQPQRPLPDKEILWGTQDGGCNHFPVDKSTVWNRKNADKPEPLRIFGDSLKAAVERIWIVDEYLLMPEKNNGKTDEQLKQRIVSRIDNILEWLHLGLIANDVRILTKRHTEIDNTLLNKFQQRANEINAHLTRRGGKCRIEVRTHLTEKHCNFLHDRFAIIDDELWHFGGTVGGFHSSVSAASRGWRASDHGAINFFEMIWNPK